MGATDWAAGAWAFAPAGAVTAAARAKTTLKDFVVFMVACLKRDFCKRRIGPKTRLDKPTVAATIRVYGSIILCLSPEVITCWLLFPLDQVISIRA